MNPSNQSPLSPDFPTPENAQREGAGVTQKIKDVARDKVNQIKSAASDTAGRVKEQAAEVVGQQKTTVADRIGGYSSAVHKSAESLEANDPNIAWLTHRAADRLSGIADYVRNHDFADLRNDAEDLARQHPAAFFGGLFVAGLVVGNLFKASGKAAARNDSGSEDSFPRAENVPSADIPGGDPWPSQPRGESIP